MEFGLEPENIEAINSIFESFPKIEKVIIYGSRAKGNFRHNSDIDLSIAGEVSEKELLSIKDKLDTLNLIFIIDISILSEIRSKDLIEHINRVGKVFYKRQ
ncbi:MAG: nucleotidyltransferase domain-containing protein [Bacteroidales bacterium]|nr:nucleotidyltransferase domain-containing protein [Bacteroidales bacterium]